MFYFDFNRSSFLRFIASLFTRVNWFSLVWINLIWLVWMIGIDLSFRWLFFLLNLRLIFNIILRNIFILLLLFLFFFLLLLLNLFGSFFCFDSFSLQHLFPAFIRRFFLLLLILRLLVLDLLGLHFSCVWRLYFHNRLALIFKLLF